MLGLGQSLFPFPMILFTIGATSALAVSMHNRCPVNMTRLASGGGWSACGFPNILTDQRGCGRSRNVTWQYRMCDPNDMLSDAEDWAVEEAIRDTEITSPHACLDSKDAAINFTYGFAILDTISVPDLSSSDKCINNCGTILPVVEGREPTEEELNLAMETLAKAVLANWGLGACDNDVIAIYCQKYQRIQTAVGSKAQSALSASKLQSINAGAVDYYFQHGEMKPGIEYLLAAYKHALLGFSPAYILLAITGGLLFCVAFFLYFVFNIGRELTLNTEGFLVTALQIIMYSISLIWLVKAWMLVLGWMLARPKVRVIYFMAPMLFTLLGILLAWVLSPKIKTGYTGYGSSY